MMTVSVSVAEDHVLTDAEQIKGVLTQVQRILSAAERRKQNDENMEDCA